MDKPEMLGDKMKTDHSNKCLEFLNALELAGIEKKWECICWQVDIVKAYRRHNRDKKENKKANRMFKFKEYFKGVRYER